MIRKSFGTPRVEFFLLALCLLPIYGFTCLEAAPLEIGVKAPCTGVLVPTLVLDTLRLTLESTEADLIFHKDELQLKIEELAVHTEAADDYLDACEAEVASLRQIALDATNTDPAEVPWYESVPFVVTVTAVISVGLAIGFYALADHLADQQ
jgi:hypothetical protein